MKNGKRYALLLAVLAIALVLVSCKAKPADGGDDKGTTAAQTTASTTSQSTAGSSTSATVLDVKDFEITPPDGWTADENVQHFWYAPTYPDDPSNMNIQLVPVGSDFDEMMNYTADDYKELYEASFEVGFGEKIPVNVLVCEKTVAAGFDAMVMALEYELYGTTLFAKQYVIEAGKMGLVVTLTQEADADWESAFDSCVNGIVWKY